LFLFKNFMLKIYMSEIEEKEIDYLTVDEPIQGQKFFCISFVEPSVDRLAHKESYIFHNFMEQYGHILYIQFCKQHGLKPDTSINIELKEIYERYTDFKAIKYKELCLKYDDEINNETHIRALKVRGSYASATIAEAQAKKLRKQEKSFDVFVGQVGYWVPFNPININDVSPEYMEENMQKLVKTHIEQESKKEEVFEKRKKDMLEQVKIDNKKDGVVELIEKSDESNKIDKTKHKKELPPKLKAKLQQQLLEQVSENCIEFESEEIKQDVPEL